MLIAFGTALILFALPGSSLFTFIQYKEDDDWLAYCVNVALWVGVYYFSCLPVTTAVDFLQAFLSKAKGDRWYRALPIDFHRRILVVRFA